jgi:hypothetical protein
VGKEWLLLQAIVYHDRSRDEVSQPLLLLVAEHRDHADEIERLGVHDAQQVARKRLEERDLSARVLDHANLEELFPWSLSIPEGLEEREVTPIQQKVEEDDGGDEPLRRFIRIGDGWPTASAAVGRHRDDHEEQEEQNHHRDKLNDAVDQDRKESAADSGHGKPKLHLLGRFDVKLIGKAAVLVHRETSIPYDLEPLDCAAQGKLEPPGTAATAGRIGWPEDAVRR